MRRALLPATLVAALALPATAGAQSLGLGAKGGVTFARIVHEPSEDYGISSTADIGFLGGGFLTLLDHKAFSIQVDGVLALRKVDFGVSLQELTSVDVPAVARYRVWAGEAYTVRATGGIMTSMILRATETTSGEDPFDVKAAFESVIFSAVVGGQLEWKRRWLFEGRVMFGLSEVDSQPIEGFTSRLHGFEITAGYRFR